MLEQAALVAILGYPLKHTISPAFQQAAFDRLGIPARYVVWETPPDELPSAVERLRRPGHLGANVTVPHKETILPLVDAVDPVAQRIGAVNTIVVRDGELVGHNTDVVGFVRPLTEAGFDPAGRHALILGAGGAARAVAFALLDARIGRLAIANRDPVRAAVLIAALGAPAGTADAIPWGSRLEEAAVAHLIVNCTTIGMAHGPGAGLAPLLASEIPPGALVYDLVYTPEETPLLRAARAAGARTIGGLPMLVYQGAASFQLWTRREPPLDLMFAAARQALQKS